MKKIALFRKNIHARVYSPLFCLLTLAFLLGTASLAWGQIPSYPDYPTQAELEDMDEWDGTSVNGQYKISSDMEISSTVIIQNTTLYLYPVGNPTITKKVLGSEIGVDKAKLFYLYETGKLFIIGNESNKLNIYGNCGNGTVANPTPIPTSTTYQGAAIYARNGSPEIWLKHVEFYGFITHTEMSNGGVQGDSHGGIVTMGHHSFATTTNGVCNMDHVTFKNSYGGPINTNSDQGFGRIISLVNGTWTVTLDNVTIHDCIISEKLRGNHYSIGGMGSVIRSQGNVGGALTMRNCVAHHNTYRDLSARSSILNYNSMDEINAQQLAGQGGVVNWRSGKQVDGNTQVTIQDCNFYNNSARCGGAVATCATINMVRTNIHDNEAVLGGGVYFYTYNGTDKLYNGRGFEAIFGDGVNIYNNSAKEYGGAAYMTFDASDDVGFDADKNPMSPHFQVQINTGCDVYGNKAPKGSGFAIIDGCPYSHYNNTNDHKKWSLEYRRTVTIDGGKVYDNYAQGTTGDTIAGGGLYIEKYEYPRTHAFYSDYTNHSTFSNNSGTINVNLVSGQIYNNTATNGTKPGYGGGIYIASKFTNPAIVSTLNVNIGKVGEVLEMYKNQAYTDGGGVYVLYDRTKGRLNQGTVTVANGTIGKTDYETANKALNGNGGGICVMGGTVFVNGGNIEYNTAGELGGGVYVSVPNDLSTTTIQGGANISRNTAKGGGGVYVDRGELDIIGNRWNPAANSGAGAWELVGWGAGPYDPGEERTHTRITCNTATAGNGGGVNAGNGEVDITNSLIYLNEASGSVGKGLGGGVYLDGGFIEIVDSKVLNNTAETNGGGVNDHSGDINIYGGDISYNTATNGNGGGIYTNAGDIIIWPGVMKTNPSASVTDSENTGTTIFFNSAGTNGGGLNTHIGRLDVRFARVRHNVAGVSYGPDGSGTGIGGCGGGIYCEGPHANLSGYTVRLIHTNLKNNKAYGRFQGQDMYGCGGGIYLKYGSIFAEHCDIWGNFAHGNGGGLDNHDGELRVYGCIVGKEGTTTENDITYDNGNVAQQGNGGGLNTQQGNIVVGPCDTYGYVNSKSSQICHNEAGTNGGGINNHEGDIIIHGDRINHNTAHSGKGGGVYVERGNIDMFGGQINHNHADDPSGGYGGGVYAGGGTFKIMEREANPILEIMEIMDVTTTGFTVHFHHVDRGYAMENGATNKAFGIAYSTTPYPANHTSEDWENSHKINFSVDGSGNITPSDPISYIRDKGCSKVVVSHNTEETPVASNTTYYVIAYGKYTYNGKDYFDASPAVAMTTYGTLPVVVTGVAFDVTATSASVNAKQFYAGSTALTARGIEISSDGGNTWTAYPSNSVGNVFSVVITGLSSNATYKARAYATNISGTGYGSEIEFTTSGNGGGKAAEGNYPKSIYPSVEENPFFMELTPLQQAILASTPEVDTTKQHHSPAAKDDPTPNDDGPVDIPEINYNTATYGGGVCIDKQGARLIFSGSANEATKGQINHNYASEAGGGIYIGRESADQYAQMQMTDKCEVNYNHVPVGKHGGGIYLDGRLYVGENTTDSKTRHGLRVDRNFTSSISQEEWLRIPKDLDPDDPNYATLFQTSWDNPSFKPDGSEYNNVFLTRYDYNYHVNINNGVPGDNNISVITLLSDISGFSDTNGNGKMDEGESPYSHIGFSVLQGFCPVIATASSFGGAYNTVETTGVAPDNPNLYENWLFSLMMLAGAGDDGMANTMKGAVFEDSESYVAVHTRRNIAPFLGKFIYLWGCWTHPVVMTDPETDNHMKGSDNPLNPSSDPKWKGHYVITNPEQNTADGTGEPLKWEIYSPEGLAWFTSYVNGLNIFDEIEGGETGEGAKHFKWDANKNPKANAKIMNDLDMSAYLWVPIGSVQKFFVSNLVASTDDASLFYDSENPVPNPDNNETWYTINKHYYCGTFDGQGHVIKGIQGLFLTGIRKYGLFGYLAEGAVVKNTFVDDGLFVSDGEDIVYSAGGIAGEMKAGNLSNSEARMTFNATYSHDDTYVGGLVGEVKGGDVHSCMAMPTITGTSRHMGGLVGKLNSGFSLKNSFANVLFTGPLDYKVGGIVGVNNGEIENVYVRYNNETNTPNIGNDKFYWIAGNNVVAATNIKYCFTPVGKTGQGQWLYADGTGTTLRRTYDVTNLVSGKYGFAHNDQEIATFGGDATTYIETGPMDENGLKGLLASLNNWVKQDEAHQSTYTIWTRTMGSPINDDYPILQISDFNSVGSKDKIYMLYEDDINHMWKETVEVNGVSTSGKNFQALNTPESVAAMYLYNVQPEITPATNPVTYVPVSISGNTNVPLYIHEDIGITQIVGDKLTARVGVTIKDANWHLFSSALGGAPMGLNYHSSGPVNNGEDAPENIYTNRALFDPDAKTTWTETSAIYFPTNTPYGTWRNTTDDGYFDLYDYSESYYHWINYKRADNDHWHMDADKVGKHKRFSEGYENDVNMEFGKGYLMSLSNISMMMADGVLNNESMSLFLPKSGNDTHLQMGPNARTDGGYTAIWRGIHLLGNPYQSYLNFGVSGSKAVDGGILPTYAILDESLPGKDHYIYYTVSQSRNVPLYANGVIHPHQGFFVKVNDGGGSFSFNVDMRQGGTITTWDAPFRDNVDYLLVNLLCYDEDGEMDLTTVEVDRPEFGGGQKIDNLHKGKGRIYAQMEGESFQVLFAPVGVNEVPVRFEAVENGVFTLNWNTRHGEFSYLHLIDNITGVDIDCLTTEEYRFEASVEDYKSRFKLVFRCDNDDLDEPEEPDDGEDADHFAFMFGGELIVNGEGMLQMFDVQGRCLMTTRVTGGQSSVSLPKVACGVYLLRLIGNDKVKVQKMVIK